MRRFTPPSIASIALMLILSACSSDAPEDLSFQLESSCGRSFAAVNDDGTAQLSIAPVQDTGFDAIAPGLVDLRGSTWKGELQIGSGLLTGSCVGGSDREGAQVDEVWTAAGGLIDVPQLLPATADGGGAGSAGVYTIVATDLVFTNGDDTLTIPEVTLTTTAWGVYGG